MFSLLSKTSEARTETRFVCFLSEAVLPSFAAVFLLSVYEPRIHDVVLQGVDLSVLFLHSERDRIKCLFR